MRIIRLMLWTALGFGNLSAYTSKECRDKLKESWEQQTLLSGKVWAERCAQVRPLSSEAQVYLGLVLIARGQNTIGEVFLNEGFKDKSLPKPLRDMAFAEVSRGDVRRAQLELDAYSQKIQDSLERTYPLAGSYSFVTKYCAESSSLNGIAQCQERLKREEAVISMEIDQRCAMRDAHSRLLAGFGASFDNYIRSHLAQVDRYPDRVEKCQAEKQSLSAEVDQVTQNLTQAQNAVYAEINRQEEEQRKRAAEEEANQPDWGQLAMGVAQLGTNAYLTAKVANHNEKLQVQSTQAAANGDYATANRLQGYIASNNQMVANLPTPTGSGTNTANTGSYNYSGGANANTSTTMGNGTGCEEHKARVRKWGSYSRQARIDFGGGDPADNNCVNIERGLVDAELSLDYCRECQPDCVNEYAVRQSVMRSGASDIHCDMRYYAKFKAAY